MTVSPTNTVEEPDAEEVVVSRGYTPFVEDQQPLPVPQDDGEQLFQTAIWDVLPMIEEWINRIARTRPFLEEFLPINDNSPIQIVSREANDLTMVISSSSRLPTIIQIFLLIFSFAVFSVHAQGYPQV